jgi:hypothetical protein
VLGIGVTGASSDPGGGPPPPRRDNGHGHWFEQACNDAGPRQATCGAQVVSDSSGDPLAAATPFVGAYGPNEFHGGYNLPDNTAAGLPVQTIAIVDAYDDPTAESDLAAFDSYYASTGIPACTTANGCFRKVNQNGGTTYPSGSSWRLEIALDVETAHEICWNCKILLVEANDNNLGNLGIAENTAVALGANEVSNSWSSNEYSGQLADETSYFEHPGVALLFATGDNGFASGTQFPASSQYVTAVGGTTLNIDTNDQWTSETVWNGTGSGCSAYDPKPSWQSDTGCGAFRTTADISADADPNTGAAVYSNGRWYQVGGTSLATPLIAGVYGLAGNASVNYGSTPYDDPNQTADLHDIVSGNNGACGSPSYLCTAGAGFDGPTGLGTPNGLGAFTAGPPAPGFSLGVSPASQSVPSVAGGNAGYTVSLSTVGGYSNSVTLSVTGGLPAGATWGFTPTQVTPGGTTSSSLWVTVPAGAAAGSYTFTISGTDGTTTRTTQATVVVQPSPPTVTATPSAVNGGTAVTVAFNNVPSPATSNWIGLYATGAGNGSYLGGFYDDSCGASPGNTPLSAGSCAFTMPNSGGTFEFRLFTSKASGLIATSNTVTVTVVKVTPTFSTSASPSSITLGAGTVKDTASLTAGSSPHGTITFNLYGPSDPNCQALPLATSTATVNGNGNYSSASYTPAATGTYQWIASYSGDGNNNAVSGTCGTSGESVTVNPAPPVTLAVNTTSARRGSSVTVSWSGVVGATSRDWIGDFVPSAPNTAYISLIYDSNCSSHGGGGGGARSSGSCSFRLPNTPGTYQFRLFSNNTYTLLATSANITVT